MSTSPMINYGSCLMIWAAPVAFRSIEANVRRPHDNCGLLMHGPSANTSSLARCPCQQSRGPVAIKDMHAYLPSN